MKPHRLKLSTLAVAGLAAMFSTQAHAQASFTSTTPTTAWNAARWNNSADGPTYTSAFTASNAVNFTSGTYTFNTGIGSGTINIGNVTLADNVTVTFSGTTAGTYATGGAVRTIDVGTNSVFNMAGQGVSTAAGTGFIKTGAGTWTTAGGAYTGGFTLNAGTVALAGINGMGAGGALTINGGTIRSNSTTARDLTGKYTGITIGGNFTLGDATNNGLLTFSNNMALGANSRAITVNSNAIFGGVISGNPGVGIVKAGTGTLTLSGANTFTGAVVVDAGTLAINSATALGTTAGATTVNGGNGTTGNTLSLTATSGLSIAENINLFGNTSGRATLLNSSAQNHTLTGTLDVSSDTNLSQINSNNTTGSLTVNGNISGTLSNGAVLFLRGNSTSANNRILGNLNLTGGNLSKTDAGTWLVGASGKTYSWADTGIAVGTLKMGVANVLPSATTLIFGNPSGATTPVLDLNGFNQTVAGIVYNGGAASTGTKTITNSGAAATFTVNNALDFSPTGNSAANSAILTGSLSLLKQGVGKLTLSGANTFTGSTSITGGALAVSGAGDINGTSGITVNGAGAKLLQSSSVAMSPVVTLTQGTLTGSGTVNTVDVGAGTGAILSNNDGTAGAALTVGTLTFNGIATVNTFSNSTSAAIVTTSLVAAGSANQVTVNPSASVWTSGATHDLISYSGGSIGGAGGFGQFVLGTVSGLTARQSAAPALGNSGTAITLAITGDNPKWTGLDNGNWQLGTTGAGENWKLVTAGTATTFLASDDVLFDDSATGTTTVDINAANVNATATTFSNSTLNYTLGSSGGFGISSGSLTKSGTGSLTITNANTYTGATTISGGTLSLGNGGATGSLAGGSAISIAPGATFKVNQSDTVTQGADFSSAPLTGAGSFTQAGSGTTVLNAANTHSGGTTVSAGTLQATINAASSVNALGSGAVSVAGGSTLLLDNVKTTNITDTIANTFTGSGLLKLQFAANATARNTGMANVTGFNGTIQLSSLGTTGDKWNAPSIGTVPGSLIVDSGNTIYVSSGTTAFTGGTTINGGGNTDNRGAIRISGATTIFGGNISLASSSTISSETAAAQFTGNISTSVAGAHTLTLGGTASVGAILSGNISDGTGTLAITQAVGSYTLSGNLSHSGGVSLTAGLLTLSGASNTYAGVTNLSNAGRSLHVATNNALGAVGAGNETTVFGAGAGNGAQLGIAGGVNYTAAEKVIGSGAGSTTNGLGVFVSGNRGFIQAVGTGNATFAGDIELNANGTSRIGTQDGSSLTLTGAITQGAGVTTANILFRSGGTAGDFVTLSNSGNSFGGDSTVFSSVTSGNWAGLRLGVDNALPTTLTITAFSSAGTGTALDLNGKNQTLNGLATGGAALRIINQDTVNASTLTLNPSVDKSTSNTLVLGGGGLGVINVVKEGSFTQTLGGVNTYNGTTTVNGGTLKAGSATAFGDSNITVNTGGTLDITGITVANSITLNGGSILGATAISGATTVANNSTLNSTGVTFSGIVTIASGGTAKGTGNFQGGLVLNAGAAVSPGNSPGILSAGSTVWNGGSAYVWDVKDASGVAGPAGFDLLAITGTLDLTGASSSNRVSLIVTSLGLDDLAGLASNFNTLTPGHTWTIVSTTGGITGFSADKFNVNLAAFLNLHEGASYWSLQQSGNNIDLIYVPEPSTYAALAGLAVLGLAWKRRRRG